MVLVLILTLHLHQICHLLVPDKLHHQVIVLDDGLSVSGPFVDEASIFAHERMESLIPRVCDVAWRSEPWATRPALFMEAMVEDEEGVSVHEVDQSIAHVMPIP